MTIRPSRASASRRTGALRAAGLLVLAACSTEPDRPGGATVAPGSTGQTAPVGTAVTAPAVVVTSERGTPLAGVTVVFAVTAGGGTIGVTHATTTASGTAGAGSWTLGTAAGPNRVTATVAGLAPVIFDATGTPDLPAVLAVTGDSVLGVVGEEASPAPRVRVRDRFGNPVPNVPVVFSLAAGGGSVEGASTASDADGVAAVGRWVLGGVAGPNSMLATAGNLTARLTAIARPAAPTALEPIGDGQSITVGHAVPMPAGVLARDRFGNAIPGLPVTIMAGGGETFDPAPTVTDAGGKAVVTNWRPGTIAGLHSLTVTVNPGPSQLTAVIKATAVADVAANLALIGGNAQSDSIAALLPAPLMVQVRDQYGNPTSGVVTFRVMTGGGSIGPSLVTTGPDGNAAATWRVGPVLGVQVVQAAVQGTAIPPVVFTATVDFAPVALQSVTAGGAHVCGLTTAGEAWCWGSNSHGQVGDGTTTDQLYAVQVQTGLRFVQLAMGGEHSCGRTAGGQLYCWGSNQFGQLGDGTQTDRLTPTPVSGNHTFADVDGGAVSTCGVVTGGAGYCWGYNQLGNLGTGTFASAQVPTPVVGGYQFTVIRASFAVSCGLATSGATLCWGRNDYGALGDPAVPQSPTPVAVVGGHLFVKLGSGWDGPRCAIDGTSAAYCWGFNGNGNIGNGQASLAPVSVPTRAAGGLSITDIATGEATCAATTAGRVVCFGNNSTGQLGNGTSGPPEINPVATLLPPGVIVRGVTAGQNNACAATTKNLVYCWGISYAGQGGDGRTVDHLVPALVRHR